MIDWEISFNIWRSAYRKWKGKTCDYVPGYQLLYEFDSVPLGVFFPTCLIIQNWTVSEIKTVYFYNKMPKCKVFFLLCWKVKEIILHFAEFNELNLFGNNKFNSYKSVQEYIYLSKTGVKCSQHELRNINVISYLIWKQIVLNKKVVKN